MTIASVTTYAPATTGSAAAAPRKAPEAAASFDNLLHSLRGAAGSDRAAQQAAADLFRIEMMQRSLDLAGGGAAAAPGALAALEGMAVGAGQSRSAAGPGVPRPYAEQASLAPQPAAAEAPTGLAGSIESSAARYLGTPYRFGGESSSGIDCSSFVQKVFRENQIELPRTAREQIAQGTEVAPGELKKGDLVFFHTYASYPSHVGIYLGDGKMIHASSGKGEVTVSNLDSDYYRSRFIGAKRVV